ncbi:hypothetical protein CASFOL_033759 [Castilleja foliolosa]|uniref:NPH3 domain-containing protein n=1 Tax=Castilleja foliolosa TaxID=1961234 RepID=A0ABD3BXW0_9LAMI
MAARKGIEERPSWRPRSKLTSEIQLHICGSLFTLDKVLFASKSSKITKLLQKNSKDDLSALLPDIPADQESMELVGRFCHGFEIALSTQNVVRVACLAHYLGMTDSHCKNNLLSRALSFFEHDVIASWNNSIKAVKSAENVFSHAHQLGLIDYCVDSIISKAIENPCLLGEPFKSNLSDDDDDEDDVYRPNARRKLFDLDWKSEDLTNVSLRLYAPIIHAMSQRPVPHEYLAANLCRYASTWLFEKIEDDDETPSHEMKSRREIVETISALLPHQTGLVPCTFLSEMLKLAIGLDASAECKDGLEMRIGKQLDRATVNDLLLPSRGYAKAEKYDTECVRRILKNFYCNYEGPDPSPLNMVSELIDEFLAEISADIDLKTSTFLEIADMSIASSTGTQRTSDGIYRALDIYLEKHRHLTETEREKVCRILDCNKLSGEACEHAARNERLPVRVVVQVLFVVQLKLREAREVGGGGEEVKAEMERMGSKVMELEKKCGVMKRELEMERSSGGVVVNKNKKGKVGVWREMKRKLGCITNTNSVHDCNCHVKKKKVHPR